jgi:hypothetical protein
MNDTRRRGAILDRSSGRSWMTEGGRSVLPPDDWDLTVIVDFPPPHVPDGVQILPIGDFSAQSISAAVAGLVREAPLDRLSTSSEHYLEVVAALRETHGISGHGVEYTARLRDKWLMKENARAQGVLTLAGTRADDLEPWLRSTPNETGYVLKPRDESGSTGVLLLADADAVRRAVAGLPDPSKHMVEVRCSRPIVHVDVAVGPSQVLYQVSQYERPCHVTGRGTPLSSYTVDDAGLLAGASLALNSILDGWRITNDVLHIELFAEPEGLILLELAGRPGAAGVPQVFAHTRGLDLSHAKTLLDFGLDPRALLVPPIARHAGWTVLYAPTDEPAVVDDRAVTGHATRSVLDPTARRIDGIAGLGVATYSFAADTVAQVRSLIRTYEEQVRVVPARVS